jgi:hypothetical protein
MDLAKLNQLSTETLRQLNSNIVVVLRHRQAQTQITAGSKLRVGGKATFTDRSGRQITVIVEKINVKTANCTQVDADSGRRIESAKWRVAPTLLTPVESQDRPSMSAAVW